MDQHWHYIQARILVDESVREIAAAFGRDTPALMAGKLFFRSDSYDDLVVQFKEATGEIPL
jgi:hypothetical protein